MILCADIGGTKTQLCLVPSIETYQAEHLVCYQNTDFCSFPDLLVSYLERFACSIDRVSLAIAGPVMHGRCQMTNLPWQVCCEDIKTSLHLADVQLWNDLVATAFSIPYLPAADFLILQNSGPIFKNGPIAVVSIGTGLGESVLVWDDGDCRYKTLGSEGGHKDFAPHSPLEMELYSYLLSKLSKGHLSAEKLISGQGLVLVYQFLSHQRGIDAQTLPSPEQISEQASIDSLGIHAETVSLFIDLVASEAANVALQYMSTGGIVIAGGIIPKLTRLFSVERFLSRFHDKGRFNDWLKKVPIVVCENAAAPLVGAFHLSRETQLQKGEALEGV